MSGNGDSCDSMQVVEGETTVVDGAQDNGQNNNYDGGYGTLSNSPASSTETLNNDNDAPNETMAVDNEMEIDQVANDDGIDTGTANNDDSSYFGLTCDGCEHPYDDTTHLVLSGSCRHARCRACWKKSNCLCPVCNMYSENLRSCFPDEPTEVIKTYNTMNKGVVMKSSPSESSGAASMLTAKMKSDQPSSTAMSKGVLLKSSAYSNSSSGTASSLTVKGKSDQQSATAMSSAQVKIRCMDGTKLDETVQRSMTVNGMKKMIQEKTGISQERQNLLHKGKTMTDNRTLHSYSVENGSTIQMAERQCYGG